MKILFGPYGSILPSLGVSSNVLNIAQRGQQEWYRLAVEMIARGYANAGATVPTVNAFYLRPVLHAGFLELYKEILALNLRSLLTALAYQERQRIALCLGPTNDCYDPKAAPDQHNAYLFHKQQYELCLDVIGRFGLSLADIVVLHETIGTGREALGIAKAACELKMPLQISFIVDATGHLLSGESVETVINSIDKVTAGWVEGYSLNCCSPYAFDRVVETFKNKEIIKRLIGFYPNSYDADPCTYESEEILFEPRKRDSLKLVVEKAREYSLSFVGGCCGFAYHDIKLLVDLVNKK